MNFFTLLRIPHKYLINKDNLKKQYINAIKISHPNNWVYNTQTLKQFHYQQSIHLNEAYTVLKNDILRGIYMLEINNIKITKPLMSDNKDFYFKLYPILQELEYLDEEIRISLQHNLKDNLKRLYSSLLSQETYVKEQIDYYHFNRSFEYMKNYLIYLNYLQSRKKDIENSIN